MRLYALCVGSCLFSATALFGGDTGSSVFRNDDLPLVPPQMLGRNPQAATAIGPSRAHEIFAADYPQADKPLPQVAASSVPSLFRDDVPPLIPPRMLAPKPQTPTAEGTLFHSDDDPPPLPAYLLEPKPQTPTTGRTLFHSDDDPPPIPAYILVRKPQTPTTDEPARSTEILQVDTPAIVTPVPQTPIVEPVQPAAPVPNLGANGPLPICGTNDHAYFIVINGCDPLYCGKLDRFCQWIEEAGYSNVYRFPMRSYAAAESKICCIRQEDPAAKIVVVGYSLGANVARTICHSVEKSGVCIDVLVYLSGDMIGNIPYSRPDNVGHVVNVTAHGHLFYGRDLFWNGADIDGASNYRIDCMHYGTPRRREVLDIFLSEIAGACGP